MLGRSDGGGAHRCDHPRREPRYLGIRNQECGASAQRYTTVLAQATPGPGRVEDERLTRPDAVTRRLGRDDPLRPRVRPAELTAGGLAHVERRLAACPDLRATILLRELVDE
jgi:hypothetical protein